MLKLSKYYLRIASENVAPDLFFKNVSLLQELMSQSLLQVCNNILFVKQHHCLMRFVRQQATFEHFNSILRFFLFQIT